MDAGPSQAWALRSVGAILARVTYCMHADASFSRLQKRPIVSGALGVRVGARGCACARACSGVRAGVFLPALASRAPALRRALVPPPAACRPRRGRFRSRFSAGGVGAWLPFSSLQAGGRGARVSPLCRSSPRGLLAPRPARLRLCGCRRGSRPRSVSRSLPSLPCAFHYHINKPESCLTRTPHTLC